MSARFAPHHSFDAPLYLVEEWRTIPGYEGLYEASSLGRIRSLARTRTNGTSVKNGAGIRSVPAKILKATATRGGYLSVSLSKNGKKTKDVHQLVLLTFVGPRPSGLQSCHNDGIRDNNRIDNLRYDTPEANYRDRDRHGNLPRGTDHPNAKLTLGAVLDIRSRRAAGETIEKVAVIHQVSPAQVSSIATRRTWRHV
jgi:hypothetical protein